MKNYIYIILLLVIVNWGMCLPMISLTNIKELIREPYYTAMMRFGWIGFPLAISVGILSAIFGFLIEALAMFVSSASLRNS